MLSVFFISRENKKAKINIQNLVDTLYVYQITIRFQIDSSMENLC